jgi:hypothetical protein
MKPVEGRVSSVEGTECRGACHLFLGCRSYPNPNPNPNPNPSLNLA